MKCYCFPYFLTQPSLSLHTSLPCQGAVNMNLGFKAGMPILTSLLYIYAYLFQERKLRDTYLKTSHAVKVYLEQMEYYH